MNLLFAPKLKAVEAVNERYMALNIGNIMKMIVKTTAGNVHTAINNFGFLLKLSTPLKESASKQTGKIEFRSETPSHNLSNDVTRCSYSPAAALSARIWANAASTLSAHCSTVISPFITEVIGLKISSLTTILQLLGKLWKFRVIDFTFG